MNSFFSKLRLCSALIIFIPLLGSAQFVQEPYSFPTPFDNRIVDVVEGNNNKILVGGWSAKLEYDTTRYPLLQVVDYIEDELIQSFNPLNPGERGQVFDMERFNDTLYVLIGTFTTRQRAATSYSANIARYDMDFNFLGLDRYQSADSTVESQKMMFTPDGTLYLAGWKKYEPYYSDFSPYFAKIKNNTLVAENLYQVFPEGYVGDFFIEHLAFVDNQIQLVVCAEEKFSTRFTVDTLLNNPPPYVLYPNSNVGFSGSATEAPYPLFYFNNPNNPKELRSNLWVSDINYQRIWINHQQQLFDTTDFGLYYYNNNYDSLRFVNLTGEYRYLNNGPGAIDILNPNRICAVSTVNHLSARSNIYEPIDWYPDEPDTKIMVALADSSGNVLWKKLIEEQGTYWRASQIIATKDGGCLVVGARYKLGETDLHDPLFIYIDSLGSVKINAVAYENHQVSVWPNPASEEINFSSSEAGKTLDFIEIFNLQGQLAYSAGAQTISERINTSQWLRGLYLAKIKLDDGTGIQKRFEVLR